LDCTTKFNVRLLTNRPVELRLKERVEPASLSDRIKNLRQKLMSKAPSEDEEWTLNAERRHAYLTYISQLLKKPKDQERHTEEEKETMEVQSPILMDST
jgi:protein subunit release factor B